MKLAVRGKLVLGFGIAVVGLLLIAWRGVDGMQDINKSLHSVNTNQFQPAMAGGELNDAILVWNRGILNHVLSEDAAAMKRYESIVKESYANMIKQEEDMQNLPSLSEKGRELLTLVADDIKKAEVHGAEVLRLSRAEKQLEATNLMRSRLQPIIENMDENMDAYVLLQSEHVADVMRAMDERFTDGLMRISLIILAVLIGVLGMAIYIIRSITRPLNASIIMLGESAGQVASGSQQVSIASQKLAEGASEQASSLEETASSMEQVAATTQNNSRIADEGFNLAEESVGLVKRANESMATLKTAIGNISSSSEETSKIIKVIDEIAFQTNILSLNAAVEAARAGDAGRGFAVVADEVRNLAQRSADAARSTTDMIETSIKSINHGYEITQVTETSFREVADAMSKLRDIMNTVMSSSKEQAIGIKQINSTVDSMNDTTQYNVSSSEESAAAAEELNAQAQTLTQVIGDLVQVVGRNKKTQATDRASLMERIHSEREENGSHRQYHNGNGARVSTPANTNGRQQSAEKGNGVYAKKMDSDQDRQRFQENKTLAQVAEKARPEDIIKLDDADFENF